VDRLLAELGGLHGRKGSFEGIFCYHVPSENFGTFNVGLFKWINLQEMASDCCRQFPQEELTTKIIDIRKSDFNDGMNLIL